MSTPLRLCYGAVVRERRLHDRQSRIRAELASHRGLCVCLGFRYAIIHNLEAGVHMRLPVRAAEAHRFVTAFRDQVGAQLRSPY